MEQRLHGGEIYGGEKVLIDFSVNINPLGLPPKAVKALKENLELLSCYPDMKCRELREKLSEKLRLSPDWILCGNGASELFQLTAQALRPGRVLLPAPTFSGYERALRSVSSEIEYFELREEENFALPERFLEALAQGRPDMAFLCNPNNPVGNCVPDALMRSAAALCREKRIYLLVDECFLGFVEGGERRSVIPLLRENPYLIAVNAFTKLYAMPGLRLGFLMSGNAELLEKIRRQQPEWSVSSAAQIAGAAALSEENYKKKAEELLKKERPYLKKGLEDLGFVVYPGEANYLFFRSDCPLEEALLKKGILIRSCNNYRGLGSGYFRVAVRKRHDNRRLLQALREVRGERRQEPGAWKGDKEAASGARSVGK